jgi:hypothetical protein
MKIQKMIIYPMLILIIGCKTQEVRLNDKRDSKSQKSIENLMQSSEIINAQTFDLQFTLRVLPDNGWFLKFQKDSTYEYIHWSGWGNSEGTILEKGIYNIEMNQIKLNPKGIKRELTSRVFFIFTSISNEIDNNITIHCTESDSITYCLYQK